MVLLVILLISLKLLVFLLLFVNGNFNEKIIVELSVLFNIWIKLMNILLFEMCIRRCVIIMFWVDCFKVELFNKFNLLKIEESKYFLCIIILYVLIYYKDYWKVFYFY